MICLTLIGRLRGPTCLPFIPQELSRLRRLLTCSLEGLWWRADRGAERLQRAFAALRLARQQAGQQQPQQQEAEVAASLATVCAELRAECDNIGEGQAGDWLAMARCGRWEVGAGSTL